MKKLFLIACLFLTCASATARATTITISSQLVPNWQGGSTASLRIFVASTFTDSDGITHVAQAIGGPNFYQNLTCSVSGTTLTIPSFTIASTVDSPDNPNATYTFVFYAGAVRKDTWAANFQIPTVKGTVISWATLRTFMAGHPAPPRPGFPDQQQVQAMINQVLPVADASTVIKGKLKTSVAPVGDPIAVETHDPRIAPTGAITNMTCAGTDDTAALNTALAAGGTVIIPSGVTCAASSSFSFPVTSPSILKIEKGGLFKPITGQTVNIGGPLSVSAAPSLPYPIFTNALAGQGIITFDAGVISGLYAGPTNGATTDVFVKWWGPVTDGVTADSAAFKAACVATPRGATLWLPMGVSLVSSSGTTPVMTVTYPISIRGYDGGTRIRFATAMSLTAPFIRINPPSENSGYGWLTNDGWHVSNFSVESQDLAGTGAGGDIVRIAPTGQDTTAYQIEVDHLKTVYVGGKDVHVANNNGGSPFSSNGSIHLYIHDCKFSNGVWLEFGSDSFKMERNRIVNNRAGAKLIEASFITGAGNVTIQDNTLAIDSGPAAIFHSGSNINFLRNYCESASAVGSNGALVDFLGDAAQIDGGQIAGNLIVTVLPGGALSGFRIDNAKNIDMKIANYLNISAGSYYGTVTTANTQNLLFGIQNLTAGLSLSDGTATNSKGIIFSAGYPTNFANLPAHPWPYGLLMFVTDGTAGSNPLTGGGSGTMAVLIGGVWKSL